MRTVVLGPPPVELEALLERRRRTGADLYDEVWEGEYHMAPALRPSHGLLDQQLAVILGPLARRAGLVGTGPFNLGDDDDYRVPDRGFHRHPPTPTFVPTAAIVVEIVSPDDETWAKLDFYAAHRVEELLVVDPGERRVTWLTRSGTRFVEAPGSALLELTSEVLASQIDWPRHA